MPDNQEPSRGGGAAFAQVASRHGGRYCRTTRVITQRARAAYTSGPLFRASINGRGGPLSYDAAHHRWKKYCAGAGAGIGIHQLRHAHATELINSGVSIEVVRRRLGRASTETTHVYTLLADKVADTEIRAARRKREARRR